MILQRYVLKDLILSFLLSLAAIMTICVMAFLFQTLRTYEHLGLSFALEFIVISFGSTIPYILPVAATMSATFVYSRLASYNELLAIKAAGIHIHKIVMPAILFALMLCLISLYFYQVVTPASYHARRQAMHDAFKAALKSPPPATGSYPASKYRISYQEFSDGAFQLPVILEFDQDGRRSKEYQAREARIIWKDDKNPELVLIDTTIRTYEKGVLVNESRGERSEIKGELMLEDGGALKKPAGMTAGELLTMARTHKDADQRNRALYEYYVRYARSLAPLILIVLGLIVGAMVTKGSKLIGLGSSLPILTLYFLMVMITEGMAEKPPIPIAMLAFAPFVVMSLLGLGPLIRLYRN